jgi:hypothetical protein
MLSKNVRNAKIVHRFVDPEVLAYNFRAQKFSGELVRAESCSVEHYPKNLMRIIPTKGEKHVRNKRKDQR